MYRASCSLAARPLSRGGGVCATRAAERPGFGGKEGTSAAASCTGPPLTGASFSSARIASGMARASAEGAEERWGLRRALGGRGSACASVVAAGRFLSAGAGLAEIRAWRAACKFTGALGTFAAGSVGALLPRAAAGG